MRLKRCKRHLVWAIGITKYGRITIARNGNETECKNIPGNCGCIHAEINLLKKITPVVVFVSYSPCLNCAKALHKAGVKYVFYLRKYRKREGVLYLLENGVTVKGIFEGWIL